VTGRGRAFGTRLGAVGCVLVLLGLLCVTQVGVAAEEEEETPRCHGRRAKIIGTDGPDVLHGTSSRDVIWGGLGDDQIFGSLGNDLICGGPGADLIHGGRGNDTVDGGAGNGDRVIGDLGDDTVLGGPGEFDDVAGSLGIDILSGGPGDSDLVHGDYGYDRMDGGSGSGDIASFATSVGARRSGTGGVWASLAAHKARGDGHDRLFRFDGIEGSAFDDTLIGDKRNNVIDGGAGDDVIRSGGGRDHLIGGQGTDLCKGAKGRTRSCGRESPPNASAYVEIDRTRGGGGGLEVVGGVGNDDLTVSFDETTGSFGISAAGGIALGEGCTRPSADVSSATCDPEGPARWLMADLGPGNDRLRVQGSLEGVGSVRIAGGYGNDEIHGGPEPDLIESGPGADRLYGGAGADGLVGNRPGPTFLYGGENGDLLAAGGGCAGGRLVGGPGRDDASFAETQSHPGLLIISFPLGKAWVNTIPNCNPVRLDRSNEDMEGSFGNDVLIGDGGANNMLGQPGADRFYGGGGDDVIDARDGMRDLAIQCGRRNQPAGRVLADTFDPPASDCSVRKEGRPVPGLNNSG